MLTMLGTSTTSLVVKLLGWVMECWEWHGNVWNTTRPAGVGKGWKIGPGLLGACGYGGQAMSPGQAGRHAWHMLTITGPSSPHPSVQSVPNVHCTQEKTHNTHVWERYHKHPPTTQIRNKSILSHDNKNTHMQRPAWAGRMGLLEETRWGGAGGQVGPSPGAAIFMGVAGVGWGRACCCRWYKCWPAKVSAYRLSSHGGLLLPSFLQQGSLLPPRCLLLEG